MKYTTLVLILAAATMLGLEGMSMAARTAGARIATVNGTTDRHEVAPRNITIIVGDVPLILAVDSLQMPFDLRF